MQVLTLILILAIVAYMALFSLANPEVYELKLLLWGRATQEVYMWQVLAAGVAAGILLSLLTLVGRRSRAGERLRTAEQQLRQALAAGSDCRKRLASAEAENQRLAQRLKEVQSGGPGESDTGSPAAPGTGDHIG